MKANKIKGFIILLLAAIIWGLAFVFQDMASDHIDTFTINASRCFIATLFLIPVIIVNAKIKKIPVLETNKTDRKNLLVSGLLCGIFLCIAMNLQQFGISLYPSFAASSGRSGFITALYVVLVPILSIILKKKVGFNNIISVILATIGLYLLCFSKGIQHVYLGDLVVLGCALAFSLQILCIDKYSSLVNGIKLSAIQFFVCGVISLILMFIFEEVNIDNLIKAIPSLLYLGIASSGIGYTFQIIGQQYSNNPTLDSLVMSLESVFAVIGGAIILSQQLMINEIIGCVIMFIAIIFAQLPIRIKKSSTHEVI